MSDVVVRALKMSDEPELLALVREEMAALAEIDARFRPRTDAMDRYANYLRDRVREMDSAVFVAERSAKPVGFAVASVRRQASFFEPHRFGTISDVVVARSDRRRGIGTLLVERMRKWFEGVGVTVVRLQVASCNEPGRAFWRACGAEDYLVETWIDLTRTPPRRTASAALRSAAPGPGTAWTDDLVGGI